MPFDKSRHLCLQAFPTSILIIEGSLRQHRTTPLRPTDRQTSIPRCLTRFLESSAPPAARLPARWTRRAGCLLEKEDQSKWSRKRVDVERGEFLCSPTISHTSSSRRCSGGKPPVESTHCHCGAARCPRCWGACALHTFPHSRTSESLQQAVRCHLMSLRLRRS